MAPRAEQATRERPIARSGSGAFSTGAGRTVKRHDPPVSGEGKPRIGLVFNDVAGLYDRVRPSYPDELWADLVAITGMDERSSVLEVGPGTGQATQALVALAGTVTAVEPGAELASRLRARLAAATNLEVEVSSFEDWDDRARRFDTLVAASSWHWVDPAIGWHRAHDILQPGGWMALLGAVVVRRHGEPEVYAETADLHQRFAPGHPGWGHPPLEDEVRAVDSEWGPPNEAPPGLFAPTTIRWHPMVQQFDGAGFADLLRSHSLYRRLAAEAREPLLDAIAERIRTQMGDEVSRRYLAVLRAGPRTG